MIFITARYSIKAGMCLRANGANVKDADVGRQQGIERAKISFSGNGLRTIKVSKLLPGMDARIRPAAAGEVNILFQDGRKRLLDRLLHGVGVVLYLPSAVSRAFIGNFQKITHDANQFNE